jgi:hypothetical protein
MKDFGSAAGSSRRGSIPPSKAKVSNWFGFTLPAFWNGDETVRVEGIGVGVCCGIFGHGMGVEVDDGSVRKGSGKNLSLDSRLRWGA